MTNTIQTVSFHGQQLAVIPQQQKLYVAIKPICENIGLNWDSQFRRINRDEVLNTTIAMMAMVAADGKTRELLCLPLEMLNGWLFGIDTNRIKNPEIKARILAYKRECYQVLFDYWTKGSASNPRKTTTEERNGLKNAVTLLVSKKGLLYPEAYSVVHQRFGVKHIDELTPEQLPQAVEYVHTLALTGEYIAKDTPPAPPPAPAAGAKLDDYELQAVMLMKLHFQHVYRIFKKYDMYDSLKALGSRAGIEMIDHFKDGLCQSGMLNRLDTEWQQARIRFGLPAVEAKHG